MENKKKISSLIFLSINIFYNVNYASFCYSSLIMKDFPKICWIIPFLSLLPFLLLVFLYKENETDKNDNYNLLFKIIMLINSVIHSALILYISSLLLGNAFFKISFTSMFIIISSALCCYLSPLKIEHLFRLGTILSLCIIGFIPLFFDLEWSNQPYLDIIPNNLSIDIFKGLYFSVILNDLFLYTIYNKKYEKPISKKLLILSSFIIVVICSLQIIDSYTLVNYRYYEGIKILSLNRYFSHQGKRFFEHLDIVLLYILLTTCFFKVPFYCISTKNIMKINNWILLPLFYLIIITISFSLLYNSKLVYHFCILGSISSFVIALFLVLSSRMVKNAEKVEK